jgi:hypothetical protein
MIVTARQFRIALLKSNVDTDRMMRKIIRIEDAELRNEILISWEYSTTFDSTNPLVQMMAEKMGLSEQQVDELFELASTL